MNCLNMFLCHMYVRKQVLDSGNMIYQRYFKAIRFNAVSMCSYSPHLRLIY